MTSKEKLELLYKNVKENFQNRTGFLKRKDLLIPKLEQECYQDLLKDLDRLEKLEKTIELLKARVKMLETYHEPRSRYYHLFIGGRVVLLSREEYYLLKEVLENEI
jgi:hypothetical protein